MSKEPTAAATAQVASAVKASPLLSRLIVSESEDQTWISGEEMETDGSSDEDNCRCKNSPAKDSAKDSTVTLARLARSKGKLGKKPRSQRSGESREATVDGSLFEESASKLESYSADDLSDEDSIDNDEISWKVNREEEQLEKEMIATEKCRKEYPKICNSMDSIFNQYYQQLMNSEQVDNEIFVKGKEKLKGDLINSVKFLDMTMDNIMSKLEKIKKKTREIQLQNRLRLKEILKNNPTPSAKLAENAKKFLELYSSKELSDTSENCRTETIKDVVKSNVCTVLCD